MTWEIGGFRGAIGERVRNWCSDRRFFETISWGESPNLFGFPFFWELFRRILRQKSGSDDKVGSAATDSEGVMKPSY